MDILKEDFKRGQITDALMNLELEKECVVIDADKRASFRVLASRITKKTGVRFAFRKHGDKVKIWKVKTI